MLHSKNRVYIQRQDLNSGRIVVWSYIACHDLEPLADISIH